MEREQEIAKLVNVLRRTARMALQSEWTGGNQDAAAYCAGQYNRVLARLKELDAGAGVVFEPLAEGASLTVAAMACRQLAAYFEDEARRAPEWAKAQDFTFEDFVKKSARDIEDLGEFIRESIEEWARHRKGCGGAGEKGSRGEKV